MSLWFSVLNVRQITRKYEADRLAVLALFLVVFGGCVWGAYLVSHSLWPDA